MNSDCSGNPPQPQPSECCQTKSTCAQSPIARFENMIPNALAFAQDAKAKGQKIAGIFCEYAPRELFFAAGMVPICMCGGQQSTIPEAETELPSNLCPVIKSSYGHHLKKSNPFLEMSDLIVAETTCDGKKKMYELMSHGRNIHVMELPQKPDEQTAFNHWLNELHLLKEKIEEVTGKTIDREALLSAIERMNEERDLRREIAYLASENPPLVTGKEALLAKSSVSLIPCDIAGYKKILEWAKNRPSPYNGQLRILMTGVPHPHGAEKVMEIVEECGGAIVAQENCTGLKPIMDNVVTDSDLMENLARKYFDLPCSCMTPNQGRTDLLNRLINDFKPDGMIDLVWQACHTYNIEAELIRREARTRWNLPYLKLETDYSPSDRAQLTVRVEAFLELCRSNGSKKS